MFCLKELKVEKGKDKLHSPINLGNCYLLILIMQKKPKLLNWWKINGLVLRAMILCSAKS